MLNALHLRSASEATAKPATLIVVDRPSQLSFYNLADDTR